ncbi:MAG: hypothetical protein HZB80_00285 [Deltaproteobacteria bacterium]|nr:hypothetical protein [Deltaproteobacteria bacterium]
MKVDRGKEDGRREKLRPYVEGIATITVVFTIPPIIREPSRVGYAHQNSKGQ